MSSEFEKVVLEKLDVLSSKVNELSTNMNEIKEKVENNSNLIANLSEKVESNTKLINNLNQKVEQQGLNLARFEHDCTLKLNALFDSFSANDDSHSAYNKAIAALNAESFDHKLRISILEDNFKSSKILANT